METTRRHTGNHGFHISNTATAGSLLRRLTMLVSVFATLIAAPAQAAQWSILLNGKAVHLEKSTGTKFNEENWGAGVQYDFDMTDSKWVPFVSFSGFKDSNSNPSYYAGGGTMRRFSFGEDKGALHLDAGVVAFLMTRQGFKNGQPFPGILPVVSFGTDRIALNVTYIPQVDPKLVPIFFFQLKIGLN